MRGLNVVEWKDYISDLCSSFISLSCEDEDSLR